AGADPVDGTPEHAPSGPRRLAPAPAPAAGTTERPAAAASAEPGASSGRYRGYSWGSAVHGALALAPEEADGEVLRALCRDVLVEHERPLDEHGEPRELAELVGLVRAVRGSELWRRASGAERVLVEVP